MQVVAVDYEVVFGVMDGGVRFRSVGVDFRTFVWGGGKRSYRFGIIWNERPIRHG